DVFASCLFTLVKFHCASALESETLDVILPGFPHCFFSILRSPTGRVLFPYTTLFRSGGDRPTASGNAAVRGAGRRAGQRRAPPRSEEHTSELQSRSELVCRLLLEKKNKRLSVRFVSAFYTAQHPSARPCQCASSTASK